MLSLKSRVGGKHPVGEALARRVKQFYIYLHFALRLESSDPSSDRLNCWVNMRLLLEKPAVGKFRWDKDHAHFS